MSMRKQEFPRVDRGLASALIGKQSRRDILRRSVWLGLSMPTLSMLLSACMGDDDDDAATATEGSAGAEPTATAAGESTEAEADEPTATSDGGGDTATSASTESESVEPTATPSQDDSASVGGQVVIHLQEPDSLLSGAATRGVSAILLNNFIANGLTRISHPEMGVIEDLAESWAASDDGLTYDFSLRQGVLWQDGEPFTPEDVKFTYELWAHPEWPGTLRPEHALIDGAVAYKDGQAPEITGIQILDGNRIQFTLVEPAALFLATATPRVLLPRHILTEVSPADAAQDPFALQPIYTGPFIVEEWRAGEGLTLRAFEQYYAGRPNLDTIITRVLPDPSTAIAELRTGGIHLSFVSPDQFEQFEDDADFQTQEMAGAAGWYVRLDHTKDFFADVRVRQAMSHAIDRESIVSALYRGKAEANHSLASPLSWIYNDDIPRFEYDIDRANMLFDEAGWDMGDDGVRTKDGQRFEFELIATASTLDMGVVVQPFLADVGLEAQILQLEPGASGSTVAGEYDARIDGWFNFIIDPRADLSRHFESPRPVDFTGYANEQVDQLFQQSRLATDREEEQRLYAEIQLIAESDAVYVYLWRPQDLLVYQERLVIPEVRTQPELYSTVTAWELRS